MLPKKPNALIVVAKQPAPGQTKTRLSPPLSLEQASALYECFLQDTLEQMRQVGNVQRVIAYLPADAEDHFRRLAPDFQLIPQEGPDLGTRLDNALTACLARGHPSAVIMDSDSPTIPASYLSQAFAHLTDGADVCIGPCEDGGYYLIGVRRPAPRLLREVRMSTPSVAADTLALAKEEGLRVGILPTWYDVDDAASLARLVRDIETLNPRMANATRRFLAENAIRDLLKGTA
ncbi:MAG: TIGR04282 family arsenosugar biosynthesis glycosyltransferase [Anaerolineales bacterium]